MPDTNATRAWKAEDAANRAANAREVELAIGFITTGIEHLERAKDFDGEGYVVDLKSLRDGLRVSVDEYREHRTG